MRCAATMSPRSPRASSRCGCRPTRRGDGESIDEAADRRTRAPPPSRRAQCRTSGSPPLFPAARGSPSSSSRAPAIARPLAHCARSRAGDRPAAGRRRRRAHARARPPRAAGHADGDPPQETARRMRLRAASERRAASALARAARDDLSAGAARGDASRSSQRCTFSLDELRYEYPEEIVPPGETPASHLRKLTERRARAALSGSRAARPTSAS